MCLRSRCRSEQCFHAIWVPSPPPSQVPLQTLRPCGRDQSEPRPPPLFTPGPKKQTVLMWRSFAPHGEPQIRSGSADAPGSGGSSSGDSSLVLLSVRTERLLMTGDRYVQPAEALHCSIRFRSQRRVKTFKCPPHPPRLCLYPPLPLPLSHTLTHSPSLPHYLAQCDEDPSQSGPCDSGTVSSATLLTGHHRNSGGDISQEKAQDLPHQRCPFLIQFLLQSLMVKRRQNSVSASHQDSRNAEQSPGRISELQWDSVAPPSITKCTFDLPSANIFSVLSTEASGQVPYCMLQNTAQLMD